jgi:hypothetical protein
VRYYDVEPEVPGHIGDNTVIDQPIHPVMISKLQYVFDAVPEDILITSSPVYLLKRDAKADLEAIQPTGVGFDKVQLSKSEEFRYFFGNRRLPEFVWLRITGRAGHDDFGRAEEQRERLIISERVLRLLVRLGISHAGIEDWLQGVLDRGTTVVEGWQPKYPVNPETGQRLKVGDVVSVNGKRYVVHACDYATGKPQLVDL